MNTYSKMGYQRNVLNQIMLYESCFQTRLSGLFSRLTEYFKQFVFKH